MAARRATPRRKSLERHAWAIIGFAYFERKLLSGPRSLSRGRARICPVDSRTGPISLSVGRAPNDQASPPHDSTASLRRGLIPGKDLELDRVIINEGQNNKAALACGHLGCYRRLGESAHRIARFKSHIARMRGFGLGGFMVHLVPRTTDATCYIIGRGWRHWFWQATRGLS